MPIATIALMAEGPKSVVMMMAEMMAGKAKMKSLNRNIIASSQPRCAAAIKPSGTPISAPIATANSATLRLEAMPTINKLN